jgi:hypothetical protein
MNTFLAATPYDGKLEVDYNTLTAKGYRQNITSGVLLEDYSSFQEIFIAEVGGKLYSGGSVFTSNDGEKIDPYQDHLDEAITLDEFLTHYGGMTHYEVVTEMNNTTRLQSSADGPALRYMIDPHTGNVIDLKHMLIIGDTGGGFLVELIQVLTDRHSAFDRQDLFSNQLGNDFFFHYGRTINENPSSFTDYFRRFFQYPGLRGWNKF